MIFVAAILILLGVLLGWHAFEVSSPLLGVFAICTGWIGFEVALLVAAMWVERRHSR